MNLQSKFDNCITTKTLNITLYMKTNGITDKQTNRRTDILSDYHMPLTDCSGIGHTTASSLKTTGLSQKIQKWIQETLSENFKFIQ